MYVHLYKLKKQYMSSYQIKKILLVGVLIAVPVSSDGQTP
jgi:hypothetical protein